MFNKDRNKHFINISINIPQAILKVLDEMKILGIYQSRSEIVRTYIIDGLKNDKKFLQMIGLIRGDPFSIEVNGITYKIPEMKKEII